MDDDKKGDQKIDKNAPVSQDQLNDIMKTVSDMKGVIKDQNKTIERLESKEVDPRKKRKREKIRKIKDSEREVKMFVLDIELTEDNKFAYFQEERDRLIDKDKIRRKLLILSIERTHTIIRGDKDSYLIGEFNCVDEKDKKFKVEMPFRAINEHRTTIKARMNKKYTKEVETSDGVNTKYVRDEDGGIVDQYDIDLINTSVKEWFDLEIVTDGPFKGKKFDRVPDKDVNIL